MNHYIFQVKRAFKSVSGRECKPGEAVELTDREEVRRLLSLGFVIPGGLRTADREEPGSRKLDGAPAGPRKFKAVNPTTFYTRVMP